MQKFLRSLRDEPQRANHFAVAALVALLTVEMAVVLAVHPQGVIPFAAYLAVTVAAYRVFIGELKIEVLGLYSAYAAGVIIIYFSHLAATPGYFGFSGPSTYGTDDIFFFSQVADVVPYNMDVRQYYQLNIHAYSKFLSATAITEVEHLFDVIWVNLVGAVMLPVFARELAVEITGSNEVGRVTFVLVAICPFTLSNSLVLMRDGWSAVLFTGAILMFLRYSVVRLLLFGGLLGFIRLASGLQLVLALGLYSFVWVQEATTVFKKRLLMFGQIAGIALSVVGGFFALTMIRGVAGVGEITSLLFRSDFLLFFQQQQPDSFLFKLYQLPVHLRLPTTFIFFVLFPFLAVNEVFYDGVFVVRAFLMAIYSILFIGYVGYLVRGSVYALRNDATFRFKLTVFAFFLLILVVSQASMQIRHKVMVLPLMYIIVATGIVKSDKSMYMLGLLASILVILATVLKYLIGV